MKSENQLWNQIIANVRNFLSHLRLLYKMAAGGVAVNKESSGLQLLPDSNFNLNITAGKMFPQPVFIM